MRAPRPERGIPVRLQKILRAGGHGSRRRAEELITSGRVTINGKVVERLGTSIDPARDRVAVDGKPLRLKAERPRYILFHKPDGVMSAGGDRLGRKTVFDMLPPGVSSFFMAGRLDYHTTGLMFFTNDGEMAQMLAHPRYGVEKTYVAKVKGDPDQAKIGAIMEGPVIEGEKCMPIGIRPLEQSPTGNRWFELVLREGKKNQIRIMFEQVGHPVLKLKRVSIGPFKIGKLRPGETAELSARDVQKIKAALVRARPAIRRT